jgi:hypothetical protein
MDWRKFGEAGVSSGWRGRLADTLEGPAADSRLPVGRQEARAILGLVFVGLSIAYLVQVVRELNRR